MEKENARGETSRHRRRLPSHLRVVQGGGTSINGGSHENGNQGIVTNRSGLIALIRAELARLSSDSSDEFPGLQALAIRLFHKSSLASLSDRELDVVFAAARARIRQARGAICSGLLVWILAIVLVVTSAALYCHHYQVGVEPAKIMDAPVFMLHVRRVRQREETQISDGEYPTKVVVELVTPMSWLSWLIAA